MCGGQGMSSGGGYGLGGGYNPQRSYGGMRSTMPMQQPQMSEGSDYFGTPDTMPTYGGAPQMSQPFSAQAPQQTPSYGGFNQQNFANVAGFGMQPQAQPQAAQSQPSNAFQSNQDAYNAAISGNNTANAKPLWMQQGPIDQAPAQAKGIVLSEGQSKGFTPPNTSNPGVSPLNLPPNGGVPAKPTGPMQPGQVDWGWDNQRNQFAPSWTPAARQFIIQNAYGSGAPAPWMNKDLMNSEYTDPNFMANIQKLSGNKFGG